MFNCTSNCSMCGKCHNIMDEQILKEVRFPDNFISDKKIGEFGISFDIGTTTLVAALWSLETGDLVAMKGASNPQRNFGADVISRITYGMSNIDKVREMQLPLIKTLDRLTEQLCQENNIESLKISKKTYCGNTTMMLILAGMDVKGMAAYPFTPEHIDGIYLDEYKKSFMLPNIGGHVGGDIVAGLVSTKLAEFEGNALFVDIGTNGEIVLKVGEKLYGFSTAAGPAFEGANIKCGMMGTDGAIEECNFINDNVKFDVIGEGKPKGICGSGLISAICEMLDKHIIDKDGKLVDFDTYSRINPFSGLKNMIVDSEFIIVRGDSCLHNKNIVITQNDIREVQLAKAAIKAGIKTAMKYAGCDIMSIDKIFVAGGFAAHTPKNNLIKIGLLPNLDEDKIEIIGNSALAGTSMVLLSDVEKTYCERISKEVEHIELSELDGFQNSFLDSLKFE